MVKTADNVEEAVKLLEVSYEYDTEISGLRLFRKRKNPYI